MSLLSTILEKKRARVADDMRARSIDKLQKTIADRKGVKPHAFRAAFSTHSQSTRIHGESPRRFNIIAEVKRASPSRGVIREGADPASIAAWYQKGGAAAISVLTEEDYFKGSLEDFVAVRSRTDLPLLRKDFIFDKYQLYETAAVYGDAALLIVAALNDSDLSQLIRVAQEELEIDALVEVHSSEELRRAVGAGATLIGVNNRDLRSFETSIDVSERLSGEFPEGTIRISESGLRSREDLERLSALGYCGFLIGESLMRSEDPETAVRKLAFGEQSRSPIVQ